MSHVDVKGEGECSFRKGCCFGNSCEIVRAKSKRPVRKTTLKAGDFLQVEGSSSGSAVLFIRHGFVHVRSVLDDGSLGAMSLHGSGEALNLLQVLAAARSSYRITALVDTEICAMAFPSNLDEGEISDLTMGAIDNLQSSTVALISCLWMLYGTSVRERVRRFLAVANLFCEPGEDGMMSLPLSNEQLAFIVRAERASVAKALSDLEEAGVVRSHYGGFSYRPEAAPKLPM